MGLWFPCPSDYDTVAFNARPPGCGSWAVPFPNLTGSSCSDLDQQYGLVLLLGNGERDQRGKHASQQVDVRIIAFSACC